MAYAGIHNLTIDQAALKAHVIRPPHLDGVSSSRGLDEGTSLPVIKFPTGSSYHVDVKGFGDALHAALKDSVAGYVMRLRHKDDTIYTLQWNWAKTPADGGEGWTPDVRMHIASCSKLVTGIAMTKLLNEKKMSYDTPIAGFLPKYWEKGPNVDKITFRHLMTHRSGLNTHNSHSDYGIMKSTVAAGVNDHGVHKTRDDLGHYCYANMNFGLCRILIATINGNVSTDATFDDQTWDFATILSYVNYVRAHVFTPAGVSGPGFVHSSPDALAYGFPVSGKGSSSGNLASMIGGAGWIMSVDELLDVMGTFRRKGTIMSVAQAQTMLDDGFGIDVQTATPLGNLYNKNGRWNPGSGQSEQSLAYFLPQDMELVVLVNSPVGSTDKFFRKVVTELYLANIKSA